ncbi:MAG: DUF433 domain-containing protein [Sphingopyxis sp.]|uniref:DUF433 domain-containing protein n=1 Tax=Sphingopyxis sp. TaxID=1908224 RepID=UPI003D6D8421
MANLISAFSAEQVERLTGLSESQLRDWDNDGFFTPAFAAENRRSPYSRIYSFDDLVSLRTLGILRKKHKIALQSLKKTAAKLEQHSGRPWSDLTLYVLNREVHFKNPSTGRVEGAISGQMAVPIPLGSIADDLRSKIEESRSRSLDSEGDFEQHRYVAHNRRVVSGTRIPVESVMAFWEHGFSIEQILREYPSLTRKDIEAVVASSDREADAA